MFLGRGRARQWESGGKRHAGQPPGGNPALRKARVQAAPSAIRPKDSSCGAVSPRLASRRGQQQAILAVARKRWIGIDQGRFTREGYRELGATSLDERKRESLGQHWVRRREKLGQRVTVALPPAAVAA